MASHAKSQPAWTDVKAKLASFDRKGLLGLIQDLYAAHKDNRMFLHARFGLGEDSLSPYKETISRWLWPDSFRNQDTSVLKAKKAIADYKKAIANAAGVSHEAAREGVVFDNTGSEPLVTLRYFGPDTNPQAPNVGDHKR